MKSKFEKFNKKEIKSEVDIISEIELRITDQDDVKRFFKDIENKELKKFYKIIDRIKIVGFEGEKLKIKTRSTKFKEFREIIVEASYKRVARIDIKMCDGCLYELDNKSISTLMNMMKEVCKLYNAKVRKTYY